MREDAQDKVFDLIEKYGEAEYEHGAANHGNSQFEERVAIRRKLWDARELLKAEILRLLQPNSSEKSKD